MFLCTKKVILVLAPSTTFHIKNELKRNDVLIVVSDIFANGQELLAALLLVSDSILIGSRWAISLESLLHYNINTYIIIKAETDILHSSNYNSVPIRVIKSKKIIN